MWTCGSAAETALWLHSCKCLFLFTVFRNSIMFHFELAASISKLIFFSLDFFFYLFVAAAALWSEINWRGATDGVLYAWREKCIINCGEWECVKNKPASLLNNFFSSMCVCVKEVYWLVIERSHFLSRIAITHLIAIA